jgi:para-aminobenzoate synthetase/4-amino-4-deoxychorismate lyase
MNEIKPQRGPIRANEILLKDGDHWLHFGNHHCLVAAGALEDVLPALREIERLIATRGWYAAGFLSYEAASAFDPSLHTYASSPFRRQPSPLGSAREIEFPYLWFGLYPKPQVVTLPTANEAPKASLSWLPTTERDTYNKAIAKIKEYIARGRTYQVNYTMRLESDFAGDPWKFFLRLAQNQNQHGAYIDTGRFIICSASPELFFQLDGDTITCRPMKGTTKRGRTTSEDKEQAEWLKQSAKNRAENVMIVDMVRNDLGRIARTGSVLVPELFMTERYSTLWQMTSTVTAKTDASITEIFRALFPCASITGAPKASTMRIIAELESTPRRVYTGSIGFIRPNRRAKFSVAIRTALIDRESQTAAYGVGGGIVWDSTSPDEYAEALLKARVLTEESLAFSLLETMLWTPQEGFFLLEKHIARMLDSAGYFNVPITSAELEHLLDQLSSGFHSPQRVRVLLDQSGKLEAESSPFAMQTVHPLNTCLAVDPIDSNNVFHFHKTTQRAIYESARLGCEKFDDVLLHNESGELTEFTLGNLVVELAGQLFTPPLACGVLPGTCRAHLLETGQIQERTIPIERLKDCTGIFRVNSVRKWQEAQVQLAPMSPEELQLNRKQ